MFLPQLTIFGAGLIGGSLALAARQRGIASRIVAVDVGASPESADSPFDRWVQTTERDVIEQELHTSTLTVLCVPVRTIVDLLPEVLRLSSGWVTDCGSTKVAISEGIHTAEGRGRFVAGHPMAGRPQGGLENADAELFAGRQWILCPDGSDPEAVRAVRQFVSALGAEVIELSGAEHDRSVAITSHVPQVMASALAAFAMEERALQAAGPGFASATRTAGGAEAMWRDIFDTNGKAVGRALVEVGRRLQILGSDLEKSDVESTLRTLEKARNLRDEIG